MVTYGFWMIHPYVVLLINRLYYLVTEIIVSQFSKSYCCKLLPQGEASLESRLAGLFFFLNYTVQLPTLHLLDCPYIFFFICM